MQSIVTSHTAPRRFARDQAAAIGAHSARFDAGDAMVFRSHPAGGQRRPGRTPRSSFTPTAILSHFDQE